MLEHTLFSMLAYWAGSMLEEMDVLFLYPTQSRINRSIPDPEAPMQNPGTVEIFGILYGLWLERGLWLLEEDL